METLVRSLSFLIIWFPFLTMAYQSYQQTKLPYKTAGPESFAFDCNGEGPYTGVLDGRILKWQGSRRGWREFAVTSPSRRRDLCDGYSDLSNPDNLRSSCGRPLGLQFHNATCDLYIADAFFGLMKVGKDGGVARQVATSAENVPFRFTNSLDINQETGVVYFTDSSTKYPLNEKITLFESGDTTGRLMEYDLKSGQVKVLLRGLSFANGVALSKDNSYVIVAETGELRVIRYWLQGKRAKTIELFNDLPGIPDNVKRNSQGHFWVALNSVGYSSSENDTIGVRLDEDGRVISTMKGDRLMASVSEVLEKKGIVFLGSVAMPYVGLSTVENQK
ncbi:hypothetical protein ACHQM5_006829 [Ranunculus cassubicifolius]